MIWFDNVPSFPPQAVVGVISGVLNIRNVPAFRATSKSTVCTYVRMYGHIRMYSSSVLYTIVVICMCVYIFVLMYYCSAEDRI